MAGLFKLDVSGLILGHTWTSEDVVGHGLSDSWVPWMALILQQLQCHFECLKTLFTSQHLLVFSMKFRVK